MNRIPLDLSVGVGGTTFILSEESIGKFKGGLKPTIELSYEYRFSSDWGLRVGLGLVYGHGSFTGNNYDANNTVSIGNRNLGYTDVEYHYHISQVDEKYNYLQLDIPLVGTWHNDDFYACFGMKASLPVWRQGSYEFNGVSAEVSIPEYGTVFERDEYMGCGRLDGVESQYNKGAMGMPVWWSLTAEFGTLIPLRSNDKARVGLYFDYAVNRAKVGGDRHLINATSTYPQEPLTFSCMESDVIEKFGNINFGIRATIRFYVEKPR
ncbi:MAG: PorT family protein [Bacteroidales bacterium]|nr:PorT family protein [Bacteroidales bacterium]